VATFQKKMPCERPFVCSKCGVHRLNLTLLALLALLGNAVAGPTIFVVRHAEKADSVSKDPDLSDAGRARAEAIARVLRDAKITAIFVTEFKRTQETAEPLARALGISPTVVSASSPADLIAQLKKASGHVLVVGHGNTIPDLIKGLGLTDPVAIAENDYDNLFIVELAEPPHLLHLHLP
jgi:broad specificity phosphatase PhoE